MSDTPLPVNNSLAVPRKASLYDVYVNTHEILHNSHSSLLGRILTFVDASFSDPVQRKAMKDVVKQEFNDMWIHELRDIIVSQFRCAANVVGDESFPKEGILLGR